MPIPMWRQPSITTVACWESSRFPATTAGYEDLLGWLVSFGRVEGQFEVGRPPGLAPGSDIDTPLVARLQNLELDDGRYDLVVSVDGAEVSREPFDVTSRGRS